MIVDWGDGTSSPRAWGCFSYADLLQSCYSVFPTCVGVFPSSFAWEMIKYCLPHVRGGVSLSRMQLGGCRGSLPHVRGGVSNFAEKGGRRHASSPRAWGCFFAVPPEARRQGVFPTCVGVFPRQATGEGASSRLPHVRGGVSGKSKAGLLRPLSSPRAWGCFRGPRKKPGLFLVFPTCVGVFPTGSVSAPPGTGLPHVRGGVSQSAILGTPECGSSPRAWGCFFPLGLFPPCLFVFPTCVGVFLF